MGADRGLVRGAIAESHSTFGRMLTLAEAETNGVKFAKSMGKTSLTDLRAAPAGDVEAELVQVPGGLAGT